MVFEIIKKDLAAALCKDPAATSKWQVFFTYSGFRAILRYRFAHWFYTKGYKRIAYCISMRVRNRFAIDIHPAAQIAEGFFIDHGVGVVIGETTIIGKDCTLFQGVTLGGTGKDSGKRHPTLGDNVMISAGATILGPVTLGDGCKIGAGSVVLIDVPPHCTVVGVPGRIVRIKGKKLEELDHRLPDPILEELKRLNKRISLLEDKLKVHSCKYSMAEQANGVPILAFEQVEEDFEDKQ